MVLPVKVAVIVVQDWMEVLVVMMVKTPVDLPPKEAYGILNGNRMNLINVIMQTIKTRVYLMYTLVMVLMFVVL